MLQITVFLIKTTSNALELANTIINQKFIWILFFLLVSKAMLAQSASIESEIRLHQGETQLDLLTFLENGDLNSTFATYQTLQFNVESFEVVENVSYEMDANCALIPLWKQVCTDDASTCQLATIEIQTSEKSIITLTHALFSLNGVCELPNFPSSSDSI